MIFIRFVSVVFFVFVVVFFFVGCIVGFGGVVLYLILDLLSGFGNVGSGEDYDDIEGVLFDDGCMFVVVMWGFLMCVL